MKAIVYLLALFAAIKIGSAEYLFRTSARDVIVAAYRERAIQACQRDTRPALSGTAATSWAKPADVQLSIGKSGLDVQLWQVDHHLWNARYRNPYLVLTLADVATSLVCEYDVMHNATVLSRS